MQTVMCRGFFMTLFLHRWCPLKSRRSDNISHMKLQTKPLEGKNGPGGNRMKRPKVRAKQGKQQAISGQKLREILSVTCKFRLNALVACLRSRAGSRLMSLRLMAKGFLFCFFEILVLQRRATKVTRVENPEKQGPRII